MLVVWHRVPNQAFTTAIMPGWGAWSKYRFWVAGHRGNQDYPLPPRHIGAHELGHFLYLRDEYIGAPGGEPVIGDLSVMGDAALKAQARTYPRHYRTIAERFNMRYDVKWVVHEL
jgi:hypothetical protein